MSARTTAGALKAIFGSLLGVLAATAVLAQVPYGSRPEDYQAPVEEGVEHPDLPAAEQAEGNAEAQMPPVEQDDAAEQDDSAEVGQPPVQGVPGVGQPAVEP